MKLCYCIAGDDLEIQLTSQTLIANLKKMTFWEHVRALPSLFDNGGLFYEIVNRDLGLKDGHHCMLPGLKEHVSLLFSLSNLSEWD